MPTYDDRHFAPAAPIARVVLRHPDSGESIEDVPMLIDSGADATLVPRSAVASLGIQGTGERYRLEAFDGTTNESEAVRAVLVFLNKSFRGRFLPVESEVGVIGRNVLNCVRLLLDGPALDWEELPPTRRDA
jgi:Aspartyl protease